MEKITIKDLFNRYRGGFQKNQDNVACVGLSFLILVNLYSGYSKDKKIKELEFSLASASDMINSQEDSLYSYAESDYNLRDELFYLRSRNDTYYKVSDLKLFRYREDGMWFIVAPTTRVSISYLSVYDDVFQDIPCGRVVDGYAFEYEDLTARNVSVNGVPVAYIHVLYAEKDGYIGTALVVDGELAYREVSFHGVVVPEYSFRDENIQIRNLTDLIDVKDDDEFNINELQVMIDAINHSNTLKLEIKDNN